MGTDVIDMNHKTWLNFSYCYNYDEIPVDNLGWFRFIQKDEEIIPIIKDELEDGESYVYVYRPACE